MRGPRTAALLDRVALAAEAVDRCGDRLPPEARAVASAALDRARDRLALGADHTVVALAGGTGSGKSSLFNAISRLPVAEVGVQRPTTSAVTACVWAHDATALLDWLGVDPLRRTDRETVLDGESQAALRGLVLLDLPDHDSIATEHRQVVDRVLPQADLVVWVVDPQKYADEALHSGYLRRLAGEATMIAVVNQIDTVPDGVRADLVADVERLLAEDGVVGVGVYPVSARTGEGMGELVRVLAAAVAGHGLAEVRAAAAIAEAVRTVATHTGDTPEPAPTSDLVAELVEAAGTPGQVAALATPGSAGLAAFTGLGPSQVDRVEAGRGAWLDRAAGSLPGPWQEAVRAAVPDAAALAEEVDSRLSPLVPRPGRGGATVAWTVAGVVALLATLTGLGASVGVAVGGGWGGTGTVLVAATVVAALVTVGCVAAARGARRRFALRRAGEVADAAAARVRALVAERVADPAAAVLREHAAVVALLERAGSSAVASTGPQAETGSPA